MRPRWLGAAHLRGPGRTVAAIVAMTGIARTGLYRHLPPRPPEPVTAAGAPARDGASERSVDGDGSPGGSPLRRDVVMR